MYIIWKADVNIAVRLARKKKRINRCTRHKQPEIINGLASDYTTWNLKTWYFLTDNFVIHLKVSMFFHQLSQEASIWTSHPSRQRKPERMLLVHTSVSLSLSLSLSHSLIPCSWWPVWFSLLSCLPFSSSLLQLPDAQRLAIWFQSGLLCTKHNNTGTTQTCSLCKHKNTEDRDKHATQKHWRNHTQLRNDIMTTSKLQIQNMKTTLRRG